MIERKKKYVYPKLYAANGTYPFVRFSGSGLANGLFVWARAILRAKQTDAKLVSPTWFNISMGPYLRKEKDKRHYLGLFLRGDEISGIKKWFVLTFMKSEVDTVAGMGDYFVSLMHDADYLADYIESHITPSLLKEVNSFDFSNCVAVHVRLGDYSQNVRVPISWYEEEIDKLREIDSSSKFLVFSDGRDDELITLTSIPNVCRAEFGSSIADIIAISRCKFLIGSDSTFSGWGAFLGQVPCIFYRKHFGPVLVDSSKETVINNTNVW